MTDELSFKMVEKAIAKTLKGRKRISKAESKLLDAKMKKLVEIARKKGKVLVIHDDYYEMVYPEELP